MNGLLECLKEQIALPEADLQQVAESFRSQQLKRGEFMLKGGGICREMAFIEEGYLRMFDLAEGKEVTMWIGTEGSFITSLSSFVFGTPNYWHIQAITDCQLKLISREEHERLSTRFPKWLEFDNLLLAKSFARLEQNMFAHLHTTSQERYEQLWQEFPAMFKHVPLQYIASMLGITPETLSRLRKNQRV